MKKYFIFFTLALIAFFSLASVVWGQDLSQEIANKAGYASVTGSSLAETIGRIIKIILGLLGTIFLVLTVYAGFLWMTAAGNDEQISKAKKLLYDGAIGLAVMLAAYSITILVSNFLLQSTAGTGQSMGPGSDYCINQNPLDPNCAY
jgi:TRAP-type C4-dicarboxylate transport system permease small subunit